MGDGWGGGASFWVVWEQSFLEFNLVLISSWTRFWLVTVISKYKILPHIRRIYNYPVMCGKFGFCLSNNMSVVIVFYFSRWASGIMYPAVCIWYLYETCRNFRWSTELEIGDFSFLPGVHIQLFPKYNKLTIVLFIWRMNFCDLTQFDPIIHPTEAKEPSWVVFILNYIL
jgi:hypothetical protein